MEVTAKKPVRLIIYIVAMIIALIWLIEASKQNPQDTRGNPPMPSPHHSRKSPAAKDK